MTFGRGTIAVVAGWAMWSAALQLWSLERAPVPALDAVRYVAEAQEVDRIGFVEFVREDGRRPLFPALVCAARNVWNTVIGVGAISWIRSAQMVAALAAVMTVIPVFGIALRLVGPRGAAYATGMFASLPIVARAGADGLADSVHLLALSLGVWAVMASDFLMDDQHRSRTRIWDGVLLFGGGAALGVAMLVRPDGVVVLAALTGVCGIAVAAIRTADAVSRGSTAIAAVGFGLCLVLVPVQALRGGSESSWYSEMVGVGAPSREYAMLNVKDELPIAAAGTSPGKASLQALRSALVVKDSMRSLRFAGLDAAVIEFFRELSTALYGITSLLAGIGLWRCRRRIGSSRRCQFAVALLVGFSAMAIIAAARWGYLSARHLLPMTPVAMAFAGGGLVSVSRWIGRRRTVWLETGRGSAARSRVRNVWSARHLAVGIATISIALCMAKIGAPAHGSHRAYRDAAAWLAATAPAGARVLDTHGWTALYSQLPTYRYENAEMAYGDPALAFVVIEDEELQIDSPRGRSLSALLSQHAECVATFGPMVGGSGDAVSIYRWEANRISPGPDGVALDARHLIRGHNGFVMRPVFDWRYVAQ